MSAVREWTSGASRDDVSALPRAILRAALVVLCLLASGVLVYQLRPALNRPVVQLDVTGHFTHLRAQQIAAAAAVTPGTRLFDVSLTAVQARVQALPWVATAIVRRRWPTGLDVVVTERRAVARWGTTALLDAQGHIFTPPASDLSAPGLQALPSLAGGTDQADDVLAAWQALAPALASTPLALAGLTENSRGGFDALTRSGIALHLGPGDPLAHLGVIRRAVLPALAGKLATVAAIDLRYSNGFAVAPRLAAPISPKRKT
ncbi:MAG TPA: FtsQ-type POTRA domain-containing protein [Nevskiaceae bacterium]|nr:FtsQ-type POTRA domain-containing protein [Nevskiaceae bacterium]